MSDDPVAGVRLKIDRANKHIRELVGVVNEFLDSYPYIIRSEEDVVDRRVVVKLCAAKHPPVELAVISGEVLYLLRSALDHLATAAATRNGFEIMSRTEFPIETTREKFEEALHYRKIEQRIPLLASTLRSLEPYKGGNNLLWWLHRLNGAEKHKTIVTVASAGVGASYNGIFLPGPDFDHTINQSVQILRRRYMLDKEQVILSHPSGLQYEGDIDISMNVAFRDIDSREPYTVTDTLQQMADMCQGIMGIFESTFFNG